MKCRMVAGRRVRSKRPRRMRKTPVRTELGIMFWNARGIEEDFVELLATLEEKKMDVACVVETKIFGTDMSTEEWHWIPAPETPA